MMQESGDHRVAEAQTRNLIYESVKQDLAARAERLGIPEVSQNAAILQNQIEETKQNPLRVQIAGEALRAQQAAAAAAAAAQRHAEDVAYQRAKDVAEYGLKVDALNIERAKAGGTTGEKVDAETKAISEQLQRAGVPQARTSAELALKALNESEGGPGEALFRATTPDLVGKAVASSKANAREQAYTHFENAAIHALSGAAVSESEMERYRRELGSASDPAARRRAIANVLRELDSVEGNAKAGASPAARAAFEERLRNGAPAMPDSVVKK